MCMIIQYFFAFILILSECINCFCLCLCVPTFFFFVNIVSFALSDIVCTPQQTYVKFIKKSGQYYANEESFKIYSGSSLLYTSPPFAVNEERTIEQCLTTSTNNQYTVELLDSYGDCWSAGSYLTIYGAYGNAVFKNYMTDNSKDTFTFSLYYGVIKGDSWKMVSGSAATGWTGYSFSDSTWDEVTLGAVTATASGTQYFRKQFVGLASMAAYDVRLYYKAGVIAYINGAEVYRDNMPAGDVTSSTAATGQYADIAYRGFIRPGSEVAAQQSILAVEIHFLSAQTVVDFNAFLAIMAPSAANTDCFIYSESVTLSSSSGSSPTSMFDFDKFSYYYLYSSQLPATVTIGFNGPRPYINALNFFPSTLNYYGPTSMTLQGSNDNSQWTNVISVTDAVYESNTYKLFTGYFYAGTYSNYRLTNLDSTTGNLYMYELQPLTCATAIPSTITFTPNTYTFWAKYEQVYVKPDISEFTSCTAQNLPEGLTIDSTTCVVSGFVNNAVSGASITVSSTVLGHTYSGTFMLTIQECTGTMINVLRTYQWSAYYESFEIKDTSNQEVVMSVAYNTIQENNIDWTSIACLTGQKYEVSVASTLSYWASSSHLYVRTILSGNEMETVLRMRYDMYLGLPTSRYFNAQYPIPAGSNWHYKNGEIPSDWYSSTSIEGWAEGNTSNFPDSTNQIQLYKKSFTVSDINNIAGFVLTMKFKYGCIVYLNGHEAFRKGLTDATISTSSYSDNIYTDTIYRQVSLPIKTMMEGDSAAVNYIQQGSNTIAIGLVAANANQKEAIFDGALRMMGEQIESRVYDYTVNYDKIYGMPTYAFDQYFGYSLYYTTCDTNYLDIVFSNDRHEWINSVDISLSYTQSSEQPHQFSVKGRSGNGEWTSLTNVTNLTWSQIGQTHTLYFVNNKAYNQYRFENFGTGDTSDCYWSFNSLDLKSVYTTMEVPELSYPATTIFKDIEMGEVYANSEYYYNFQITPALPAGIILDSATGMISGTATAEMPATTYSITATKLTGGTSTTSFSLSVEVCTGGRSLVTLVAQTDYSPQDASYKVFQGIGTTGTVVASNNGFQAQYSLNYGDFCLNDGIYTLQLLDAAGDGWSNPAGYWLTVDLGEMIFELGQLGYSVSSVSTMFSSYFPFQIEYTDWKINYSYEENWNAVDYDDSAWVLKKANAIGTNAGVTTYIRKEVNIPDIANYHVLNVRVKYAGGVAAYFNGRLVARFNLEENFNDDSQSIQLHDAELFSKFHVIMSTVGGVTGKNIMAFEIHLPAGQSSSSPVVFDATGVFGVNDCAIAVDTFSEVDGSTVNMINIDELLNLNPSTYGYQANSQGTYVEWSVENLEGTKFNSFAIQSPYETSGFGFSLYVRKETSDEYTSSLAVTGQTVNDMDRTAWSVPVGIAGFKQLKYEVDVPAYSIIYISTFILQYCKPSGTGVCPGIGDYPSVGEGEISPAGCEEGYRGYSYRTCSGGMLGEVNYQYCTQKVPDKLLYDATIYNLVMGTNVHIPKPTYMNIIEQFYLAENTQLPIGLQLNAQTGEITGVPNETTDLRSYTIYGKNQVGVTFVEINISVKKGTCKADGNFLTTDVGEVFVYECAKGGAYVGTEKRACILGEKDGEWGPITGFCMPIAIIIILVVVVIIIVVVVVFILMRVGRRAKAVGGVKGKSAKASASKKNMSKKESTKKNVKV